MRPFWNRVAAAPAAALRRVLGDRRANVAPIFALVAVPLIMAVGAGVDLSRLVSSRSNLQDAVDAAGLALGHLPSTTDPATLQSTAQQWIGANLSDRNLAAVTVSTSASSGLVTITANSSVTTTITSMIGIQTLPVSAATTIKYGIGHVEVALVLDNTGSMADDNKLTSLVSAAKSLVSTLLASNTPTDPDAVKISVVPFSQTVNIGATYQTSSWVDAKATAYAGTSYDIFSPNPYSGAAVDRFALFSQLATSWGGCVETRPEWVNGVERDYDVLDTTPSTGFPGTRIVPYFAPDEPDSTSYYNNYIDDATSSNNWSVMQGNTSKYYTKTVCTQTKNGVCKSYSSSNGKPVYTSSGQTVVGSGYNYGPNFGCSLAALQRLTIDGPTLSNELNAMVAVGDTNVPLGLFWGWMTVSPNGPFSQDATPYHTPQVTKIVIVLTDGANHSNYGSGINGSDLSLYSGVGYAWQHLISTDSGSFTNPGGAMNDREARICANMKAQGIVIYAVPVEVTDSTAKSLLQACASSSDKYIDVASSSGLQAAFNNIAGSIGSLRISH